MEGKMQEQKRSNLMYIVHCKNNTKQNWYTFYGLFSFSLVFAIFVLLSFLHRAMVKNRLENREINGLFYWTIVLFIIEKKSRFLVCNKNKTVS